MARQLEYALIESGVISQQEADRRVAVACAAREAALRKDKSRHCGRKKVAAAKKPKPAKKVAKAAITPKVTFDKQTNIISVGGFKVLAVFRINKKELPANVQQHQRAGGGSSFARKEEPMEYRNVLVDQSTLFQVCEVDGIHAMSSPGNEKYVNVYLTLVPSKTPGIHPAYEEHYGNFIRDLLAKHWNMGRVYLNTTEGSTSINLCEPVPSKVPLDIITFEK